MRSPDALNRFIFSPNDLGLGRAYVAGELEIEGDLFGALRAFARVDLHLDRALLTDLVKAVGPNGLKPLSPPPEEARMHGSRHSRTRDAAAISYHYDLSNDFYRLMLGPSMTYSCAVWESPAVGLEAAQETKLELICQKLALKPGMRLLDVGCGWGSMALHAAERHGVEVVGVTVSARQVEAASERAKEAGLAGQIDIRLQDYRDVDDGPFDAISSIGMFEHVGRKRLAAYFSHLRELLRPEGRLLNHGICRPPVARDALPSPSRRRRGPGGRSSTASCSPTENCTSWAPCSPRCSSRASRSVTARRCGSTTASPCGPGSPTSRPTGTRPCGWPGSAGLGCGASTRRRCAVGFEDARIQVHQMLASRTEDGRSGFPLRPAY